MLSLERSKLLSVDVFGGPHAEKKEER